MTTKRKVRAVRSREQSAAVTLRMSPEQKDELRQIADAAGMSINQYAAHMLRMSAIHAALDNPDFVAGLKDLNDAMSAADALEHDEATTS
jgi:hypothetical protein